MGGLSLTLTSVVVVVVVVLLLLLSTVVPGTAATQAAGASSSALTTSDSSQPVCTVKGRVSTHRKWYGYLVIKAFHQSYAKVQYQITYPVKECCTNLLIYYDDQVKDIKSPMTCEERTAVLPANNNQVIPLRAFNDSNGCTFWNETGEAFYVCRGERIFRSRVSRTWFFALSRCDRSGSLNLNYVFNITGYYGECEEDPLEPSSAWNTYVSELYSMQHSASNQDVYKYLSISLGVVAGLALILAAVFFGLWFLGLRNAAKGKGSSVTSSQATMTQDDIFYVNPSLSDQQQEYSQSGSENYYEVIPERRSYESINAGLANGGMVGAGAHLRPLRSLHGTLAHHHHHHPHGHSGGHHGHSLGHHQHPHSGLAGHPHGIHHPHPMNHAGLHLNPAAGRMIQAKEMGGGGGGGSGGVGGVGQNLQNIRGVTYMFEDYPPPPYQPPKLMQQQQGGGGVGGGIIGKPNPHTMGGGGVSVGGGVPGVGHHHTLSLPANQRQRPNLVHHAYHASMAPPSSSTGHDHSTAPPLMTSSTSSGNSSSAGLILGGGVGGGINTQGTEGLMMNPQSIPSSDIHHHHHLDSMQTPVSANVLSTQGQSLNLGTFGISSISGNTNPAHSMGMAGHGNAHQLIGGISTSNASSLGGNPQLSSMGVALSSASSLGPASSQQQAPPTSPLDQCETSA